MRKILLKSALVVGFLVPTFAMGSNDLITSEFIEGVEPKMTTGSAIAIRSVSAGSFIDGRGPDGDQNIARLHSAENPDNLFFMFFFVPTSERTPSGKKLYLIKCGASGKYLDGRGPNDSDRLSVAFRGDRPSDYRGFEWEIEKVGEGYAFKSFTSSRYIDGRFAREGGHDEFRGRDPDVKTSSDPANDNSRDRQWRLIPTGYNLFSSLRDFSYHDIDEVLKGQTRSIIGTSDLSVDEGSVGSSISRTFSKTLTNSYSWSVTTIFRDSVTIGVEVSFPADSGSASIERSTTTGWDKNKTWSNSEQKQFSVTEQMVAQKAGTYRMSGWVDVIDNAQFPFTAYSYFTATGWRTHPSGPAVRDAKLDLKTVETLVRHGGITDGLEEKNDAIKAPIEGIMKGTFGFNTETAVEKLSD